MTSFALGTVAYVIILAISLVTLRIVTRTTTQQDDRPRAAARPRRRMALAGLSAGCLVLAAAPMASVAVLDQDAGSAGATAAQAVTDQAPVQTQQPKPTPSTSSTASGSAAEQVQSAAQQVAAQVAAPGSAGTVTTRQAPAYQTTPPLHGTNPHGQGTVGVVDVNPNPNRPYSGDPDGGDSGEEIVVGRARGEEESPGQYHGHITIAALFGNEILGVDTKEGEERSGPLSPAQQQLLDPICDGSDQQICLEVLTADSKTTDNGSDNDFAVARAQLGGANGLRVGAAESHGRINRSGDCQESEGSSRAADVNAGGNAVASVASSRSFTRACRDQAPEQDASGHVLQLGGQPLQLGAIESCGKGEPDVVTGIPTLAPIVCNATDINGTQATDPYVVRNALTVFALATDQSAVLSVTAAGSEALAKAPPPPPPTQCSDGIDNDGDGRVDMADPDCDSPQDDSEAGDARVGGAGGEGQAGAGEDGRAGTSSRPECSDGIDNDGDGRVDFPADPDCTSRTDDSEAGAARVAAAAARGGAPECSDGIDNDGDGRVDFPADPDCTSRSDDSEAGAALAGAGGRLPFTGTEVLWMAIAGMLLSGAGLALRRRPTAE